ncbi:hypothetical protein BDW42DRAFT_101566 [Aspergillus taichungensis]|uniref:Uncharacterized protein n=1 Tax=Aspergillus taichungensis TaxID=482145 RepID=A0A2J5HUQ0_9EURO|nr:hypothetical protein BDW42DRAFT_101566 [Aspergillus taichungensis]
MQLPSLCTFRYGKSNKDTHIWPVSLSMWKVRAVTLTELWVGRLASASGLLSLLAVLFLTASRYMLQKGCTSDEERCF